MHATRHILREGLMTGLIGFAAVLVIFAVVNVAADRSPLLTAAMLGSALWYGVTDPAMVTLAPGPILAYSVTHLAVFLLFGTLAAALATLADRGQQLWYVALFVFIFVAFHLFAVAQGIAVPMRAELSGTMVWPAGIVASLLMAWYIVRVHPRMRSPQAW
jgi:hypothetical protein